MTLEKYRKKLAIIHARNKKESEAQRKGSKIGFPWGKKILKENKRELNDMEGWQTSWTCLTQNGWTEEIIQ